MLTLIEYWLVRTGCLTQEQLAKAYRYQKQADCSLPRALWSLRAMHPRQFARLCCQILDRPKLRRSAKTGSDPHQESQRFGLPFRRKYCKRPRFS